MKNSNAARKSSVVYVNVAGEAWVEEATDVPNMDYLRFKHDVDACLERLHGMRDFDGGQAASKGRNFDWSSLLRSLCHFLLFVFHLVVFLAFSFGSFALLLVDDYGWSWLLGMLLLQASAFAYARWILGPGFGLTPYWIGFSGFSMIVAAVQMAPSPLIEVSDAAAINGWLIFFGFSLMLVGNGMLTKGDNDYRKIEGAAAGFAAYHSDGGG